MVSEAIFPTNRGYICIEKWSQIFVSGIGSVHSESEEKSLFKLKKGLFLTFRMGTSNARNKNLRPSRVKRHKKEICVLDPAQTHIVGHVKHVKILRNAAAYC